MTHTRTNQWMVAEPRQTTFGGDWTEIKLSMLRDYLDAYTTALKAQPFAKLYIDAFAGTGYRETETQESTPNLFEEQAKAEEEGFFDGSARLSLQIENPFSRYVFVEKSRKRMDELQALKTEFPKLSARMDFCRGDANEIIPTLCHETDWQSNRAVLFLDPFGMSVDWRTMEAVASTQAIDVWILFPVGIGVNRLLKQKPVDIPQTWQKKLDRVFGTSEWKNAFFTTSTEPTLFDEERTVTTKVENAIPVITKYYQQRLNTIFPKVVSNPRYLCNSKRSPMFLFTFAVSSPNPKAQGLAMKLAKHILGKER